MLKNPSVVLLVLILGLVWLGTLGFTRRKNSSYWRDVLAVGGLALLTGAFFWRPLFESAITMPAGGGDLASFQFPMYVFSGRSFNAGDFPLWNPHLFGGMPYAADIQSGLFYPLNIIFFWLGYPINYFKLEMLVVLHYWLAAAFTYALLRSLNLQRWPSFTGATIFAFCGFATAHLGHLPMFETATWFPLILLAVNQAVRRKSLAWSVGTGLLLAVDFLAGHFQLFTYNTYAMLGFWAALAWYLQPTTTPFSIESSRPEKSYQPYKSTAISALNLGSKRRFLSLITGNTHRRWWLTQGGLAMVAMLVMLGATLVQLWPFYELGNLSVRSGISYETSTQFGVWPIGLLELLLPNVFSTNPTNYYGAWSNTEVLGYLGLFGYLLAGVGLLVGRQPKVYSWFFGSMALLGLLFSLSGFTILQGWLYQFVPALKLMRASGRFLVWFDFGGAVVAAFGMQALLKWLKEPFELARPSFARTLKWIWRGTGLALVGLLLVPLPLLYSTILTNPGNNNDLLIRGINGLVMAAIILGLSAILLRGVYLRTLSSNQGASLMLALVVFDLFSANASFNPTPSNVAVGFENDPVASFLQQQDPSNQYRIDVTGSSATQVWQPDTADVYGRDDVQGVFNPLQLANYDTLWNEVVKQGKDYRATPAYALFNVGYVVARNKEDPPAPQFQTVFKDTRAGVNLNVDKNNLALPRAWLVHQAVVQPNAATLKTLLSADFKPTQTVYLAGGKALNGLTSASPAEKVQLVSESNNRLELQANLDSEGYVVISQAYYPSWKVQVDNTAATFQNADYAFGAVLLAPGQHIIKLEFAPTSFLVGGLVSGVVWLVSVAFLLITLIRHLGLRRRRRKQVPVEQTQTKVEV